MGQPPSAPPKLWSVQLPAISAHRGGREAAPAGTWEAFRSAVATGSEYVEFDVRRAADGTWVVHHDEHAGGRPVAELGYDSLCEHAGRKVPTAIEVMELIAGRSTGHVDVKCVGAEREIVGAAADILGLDGFVATTEEPSSIERMKAFAPKVRTGLSVRRRARGAGSLAHRRQARQFDVRWIADTGTDWVALDHRIADRDVLRQCRRTGLGVMLWTVNDSARIAQVLAGSGVEVLITDRPRYAGQVRERVRDRAARGYRRPGAEPG